MDLPVKFVILTQSDIATSSFNEAARNIRRHINTARANDVRFGILVPGQDQDAVLLATKMGIADQLVAMRGVESFPADIRTSPHHVLHAFLYSAGFLGMYNNVMLIDDNQARIERAEAAGVRGVYGSAADASKLPVTTDTLKKLARDSVTYMTSASKDERRLTA